MSKKKKKNRVAKRRTRRFHRHVNKPMSTVYDFIWHVSSHSDCTHAPDGGTLNDAIDATKDYGCSVTLTDRTGMTRGWVHPDGNWRLQ